MLIPLYLQYSKVTHSAVRKLNDLMNGRATNKDGEQVNVSPMVQMLSAKNLLDSLAMPEEAKIDITVSKSDEELEVQRQMNDQLAQLVQQQRAQLNSGKSISDVQNIGINVNVVEAELDE